ncbi:hypothetical protein HPB48_016386 [Haemaphysalis longicornis]|uniref:Major facilitator superfamily (MFS) profile domain-containing protein n=1 Tax=Haemaphysalis longicornis TaxID=44386 RepID=A0A9J6FNM6_HAELO|nr:hypothetical protein HPB48_016386 [Haemaphysalis longicornis]
MHEISSLIGPPRCYHIIVLSLIFVRAIPSSWNTMAALFIAADVDHWCSQSSLTDWSEGDWNNVNDSEHVTMFERSSCLVIPIQSLLVNSSEEPFSKYAAAPCEAWTYNESLEGSSVVPEWNLVCQHEWKRSMMTSVAFAGFLLGSLVMGHVSDRFGRRTAFFGSVFLAALFGATGAASPSVIWYNALRFFTCVAIAGIQTSSAALLVEILDPRYRTLFNLPYTAGFPLSGLALPGVAHLLGSWRLLQLVIGLSALACVPFMFVVQESPRWLITTGQEKRAERAIAKILRMNRRTVPDWHAHMRNIVVKIKEASATSMGPLEILRNRVIRNNTMKLFAVWFADGILYYTFVTNSVHIKGNYMVNFAISTAAEMPASLLGLALVYYCRRRPSEVACLLIGAAVAVAEQLTPTEYYYVGLSLSMAGRFMLGLSAAFKWVWTLELYPTAARGFGFSVCFTVGRVGGILAPFVTLLMLNSAAGYLVEPAGPRQGGDDALFSGSRESFTGNINSMMMIVVVVVAMTKITAHGSTK